MCTLIIQRALFHSGYDSCPSRSSPAPLHSQSSPPHCTLPNSIELKTSYRRGHDPLPLSRYSINKIAKPSVGKGWIKSHDFIRKNNGEKNIILQNSRRDLLSCIALLLPYWTLSWNLHFLYILLSKKACLF